MKVTPDEVKDAVERLNITWWPIRKCSMCYQPIGYSFNSNGEVFFNPGCGCVTYSSPPEPRTWEDVANQFNMQREDVGQIIWEEFLACGKQVAALKESK